ncbi:uncharacterized protein LTR77_010722 [Saxophila tyrrhenica]|uniref:RING-type E3 ubiquitin transferase n=1 Tax=Saxophila tyrrhenica TaxID=1690608 RepID=A0AAV9NX22_9PEZI|nr:hypothetical protein LTR77_010722 [Saxophila tyrrhenica]
MRPLRFLLALTTSILAFLLLLYLGPWRSPSSPSSTPHSQNTLTSYFNWRTPSSLFPPSAIISLTDDNSTFFLARPAAFGPLIPAKSLSGQLWIGSGFGDDHLGRTGAGGGGLEGELGCSDVPGWSDGGYVGLQGKSLGEAKSSWAEGQKMAGTKKRKRDEGVGDEEEGGEEGEGVVRDDGTDDHLHHPLPASDGGRDGGAKKAAHADIQSLQESAEIAGKVVLLSRGGCGFLEKVKWVQRRGGVALIVGDDIRGGPLVTMYARGDTSNVTIPSLFTSYTTAHLLSSLIPSGGAVDNITPEDARRLGLALGGKADKQEGEGQNGEAADQPNFTTSSSTTGPSMVSESENTQDSGHDSGNEQQDQSRTGWLSSLFGRTRKVSPDTRTSRKDQVGWVLQEEFDDEEVLKYGKKQTTTSMAAAAQSIPPGSDSGDGFVIGVQDWRDPDLVAHQREQLQPPSTSIEEVAESSSAPPSGDPRVDSITPGSGEYARLMHDAANAPDGQNDNHDSTHSDEQQNAARHSKGWLSRLFHSPSQPDTPSSPPTTHGKETTISASHLKPHTANDAEPHTGLWVTLTPTSISTSPLFDTLLVLVVSPLVTLTVVYALLLLRSRIRRRRWRAPKSVVERLPVRTYQTMSSTGTTTSSATSSISSPASASATTPLLPVSGARPIRSRPRSRTTPEGPVVAGSSLRSGDGMASPSLEQVEEKQRQAGLSEWRRRYGGKQRECVVCLEEYVDGVSRVMSLPCGHEFHVECITPWLTTRRRTCPICKGDVVRSLTGHSSSSPAQGADESTPHAESHDDEEAEEGEELLQEQVAVTRNDDPEAAQPVSRDDEMFEDLERGVGGGRTR